MAVIRQPSGFLIMSKTNLLGETIPTQANEILDNAPDTPNSKTAVLLAFSGGNDSRTLAHVVKPWFDNSPYNLELAAIDTELSENGWKESIIDFAKWIGVPVTFWKGEGREYYRQYVELHGWPGNAMHSQIQNRLKGRAFRKMVMARRGEVGGCVWILSGIRKAESRKRQRLTSPYSYRENGLFINPLFYWSNAQVIDYMINNNIPESPFTQGDCKCGCTAKDAKSEWQNIEKNSPELMDFLLSLDNLCPWSWGNFDKAAHAITKQLDAGQQWLDSGGLEDFPVCADCWRSSLADEMSGLEDW